MLLGFISVNVLKFILVLQEFCLVDYLVDFCLVLTADFEDESIYVNDAASSFASTASRTLWRNWQMPSSSLMS